MTVRYRSVTFDPAQELPWAAFDPAARTYVRFAREQDARSAAARWAA